MWISWKHEDSDFPEQPTFEQKVELFYEQTMGWQLHIADLVANGGTTFGEFKRHEPGYTVHSIRHSGVAVLHICLSYIELVGSLVPGGGRKDRDAFERGLRAIPGLIDPSQLSPQVVERLYIGARCGLYHEGRMRPGVGLGQPRDGKAIACDSTSGEIIFSPERLPKVLKAHLNQYRRDLLRKANDDLCRRFVRRFDSGFVGV